MSITITDMIVFIAIYDAENPVTTAKLEDETHLNSSQIRRSLLVLRPKYVQGGDKRGARIPLVKTDKGWALYKTFHSSHQRWVKTLNEVKES
jgi:predicted transcriptional regulator